MQRQLGKLLRNLERCDHELLSRYGVTTSQGSALLAFPGEDGVSMNELSRNLGLANSTMTRMVENLVGRGLVRRTEDAEDRRVVRVALTATGRKTRGALQDATRELQELIVARIDESERQRVLDALATVNTAIEEAMRECCGD